MSTMTNELTTDIVEDIRRVAVTLRIVSGDPLARGDYLNNGAKFTFHQLYENGGWTKLCSKAGYSTKAKEIVTDEEYFARLAKAYKELGRYPKTYERKNLWTIIMYRLTRIFRSVGRRRLVLIDTHRQFP